MRLRARRAGVSWRRAAVWLGVVAAAGTGLAGVSAGNRAAAGAPVPPVAYVVQTGSANGVGAFPTDSLNQTGSIDASSDNPAMAVAVTPDDQSVVTSAGNLLFRNPIAAPTYQVAANTPAAQPVNLLATALGGLAISPLGRVAYVTVSVPGAADELEQVDLDNGHVIPVPLPSPFQTLGPVAVSPNGATVYVGGTAPSDNLGPPQVAAISTSPGGLTGTWTGSTAGAPVTSLVVTPDGSQLYAAGSFGVVPLSPSVKPGALIAAPGATAIAITPDGSVAFVANGGGPPGLASFRVTVWSQLPQPTPTPFKAVPAEAERSGFTDLAVTPATDFLLGTTQGLQNGQLVPDLLAVPLLAGTHMPTGAPPQDHFGTQGGGEAYGRLAVTPDQAPVARLGVSSAAPLTGQTVSIDASASTVAFGTIATYQWSASGGTCTPTSGPVETCSFAAAGSYPVTVTEVDGAGTSIPAALVPSVGGVDFTGRTASRVASGTAQATIEVNVHGPPAITPSPSGPGSTSTTSLGGTVSPTTSIPSSSGSPSTSGTPTITLNPAVGPPGMVTQLTGSGFPAITTVTVTWSPGIGSVTVQTDAFGGFTNWLLILPRDVLGDRQSVAAGYPTAVAPFLVVPPSVEPGGADPSLLYRR